MKVIIFSFCILLIGCNTVSLMHSWTAEQDHSSDLEKVLVIAEAGDLGLKLEQKLEDHMSGDLRSMGYHSNPSCREFGDGAFKNISDVQAYEKLRRENYDAVLTIVLKDQQAHEQLVPDKETGQLYENPWSVFYEPLNHRKNDEFFFRQVMVIQYHWLTELYDLNCKKLIYSAKSRSFDREDAESLSHEYGKMIARDLKRKEILTQRKMRVL